MKTLRFLLVIVFIFLRLSLLFGQNTMHGGAGSSIASGTGNSFFGAQSRHAPTSGNFNTFIGGSTGLYNTSGYAKNVIIGNDAGYKNSGSGMYLLDMELVITHLVPISFIIFYLISIFIFQNVCSRTKFFPSATLPKYRRVQTS